MQDFSSLFPQAIESLVREAAENAARKVLVEQEEERLKLEKLFAIAMQRADRLEQTLQNLIGGFDELLKRLRAGGINLDPVMNALGHLSSQISQTERSSRAGFEDLRALQKVYADRLETRLQVGADAEKHFTAVHPEKIAAYCATDYKLGYSTDDVVLRIGRQNDLLINAFAEYKVDCGAFITAYNPEGTQQTDAANQRDHEALRAEVVALGFAFVEGAGTDATGEWPPEKSLFAYGMDRATASAVGRKFRQDAIVWAGVDAVPQLVLLR